MVKRGIVVTGFGPFNEHKINASWAAVQILPSLWKNKDVELIIEEIPVCYDFVLNAEIPNRWVKDNDNPLKIECVINVGVSGVDDKLRLETQAFNSGYNKVDISNKCPPGNRCIANESGCSSIPRLETSFNVNQIIKALDNSSCGVEVYSSKDAGRYLCEFVYFKSLTCMEGKALFIHVPPLDKPYSDNKLAEAINVVLMEIVNQL